MGRPGPPCRPCSDGLEKMLEELKRTADLGAEVGTAESPGYICRRCFGRFERYRRELDTLHANLERALAYMPTMKAAVSESAGPLKRAREEDPTAPPPAAKRPPFRPSYGSGGSPSVQVCSYRAPEWTQSIMATDHRILTIAMYTFGVWELFNSTVPLYTILLVRHCPLSVSAVGTTAVTPPAVGKTPPAYSCLSKRCDLCLTKKIMILSADKSVLLNKRS